MAGMELMQTNLKSNFRLTSVVRQASCTRGWLRIVIQYIFFAITVASFILIVLMSMQSTSTEGSKRSSQCSEHNCRIVCNETSDNNEEDIFYAVLEADLTCQRLNLILKNPIFENGIMPERWLSRIQRNIYRLAVIRGNLHYITPGAFMSQFAGNIEILEFENVTITNWVADTLVGLANLRQIYINYGTISNAQRNALQAVDDTLEVLAISNGGIWNPANITGTTVLLSLYTLNLSFNDFGNIIRYGTLTGLRYCKILYLNSCKITALGAGAFDSLVSVEVIYLNNNYLTTIPSGLFDGMISRVNPKPRINLQDNPWNCSCEISDFSMLHHNGLLYVDPTCHTPEELHGEPFSKIDEYCFNSSFAEVIVVELHKLNDLPDSTDLACDKNIDCKSFSNSIPTNSPDEIYGCSTNITSVNSVFLSDRLKGRYKDITESDWIRPTFLMKATSYSMLQLGSLTSDGYGLLWYQVLYPNELYCVDTLPKYLRVYDSHLQSAYTFCPLELRTGIIQVNMCVNYDVYTETSNKTYQYTTITGNISLYICTGLACLAFGATLVYGIIRHNPILLKGSSRLLFVKHKNVDALVLPPKVPLRSSLSCQEPVTNSNKICTVSDTENTLSPRNFVRMKSTRSDKSTVSYISALQPTEDQLAEWRVRRHFDNNLTLTSMNSELSIFSWVQDDNSWSPDVKGTLNITYESLK